MAKNKLTSKQPMFANEVSHANNRHSVKKSPNLQTKKINGVKVTLSTREWKTLKKEA